MLKTAGQVTIGAATLITLISMTASVLGSYFTSQLSTQQQFSDVKQNVTSVTTKEEDHYAELSRRLDELSLGQKEILNELKKK